MKIKWFEKHCELNESLQGTKIWSDVTYGLTHWGWVMHICISKLTIIGSDNDLSPGRRQAIIWTNAGILLIRPLGTNFNEMLIEILTFSLMKMRLKVSSAKWPQCVNGCTNEYWLWSCDKWMDITLDSSLLGTVLIAYQRIRFIIIL